MGCIMVLASKKTTKSINTMRRQCRYLIGAALMSASIHAAEQIDIPLYEKGTDVFYLEAYLDGYGKTEFMLDTGSGPVALASDVLAKLKSQRKATWSHQEVALLANGRHQNIEIYRIDSLQLAKGCRVEDVEVAELPPGTRNIIGINLLKKTAPFSISTAPSLLSLVGCNALVDTVAAGQ